MEAPVLLIAFNRPDTTGIVFQKIREARPTKLYVAVDGPRQNKEGEDELVEEVKKIVNNVDWQCKVQYKFNQQNKGCEVTVSSGITWALSFEEYVIILEDDIVAPLSFFLFVQKMLEKYKYEERIWAVSGVNFTPIQLKDKSDYFFAKYGHTWGWGTWRRVWDNFDLYTEIKEEHLKRVFLKSITNSCKELSHYKKKFKKIKKCGIGNTTWDNIASYMHRSKNLLYIVPRVNLISNIGVFGLHSRVITKYHHTNFDEDFTVKKHPRDIVCNVEYDKNHFKNYISKRNLFYIRFFKKIKKTLTIK